MQKTGATGWPLESDADRKAPLPRRKLHVAESSGNEGAKRGGPWTALMRVVFGTHFLALADQAVVSGTSLLSMVLVGRWTAPSELGIYTIGLSVLGSLLAIQDALIGFGTGRVTCDMILVWFYLLWDVLRGACGVRFEIRAPANFRCQSHLRAGARSNAGGRRRAPTIAICLRLTACPLRTVGQAPLVNHNHGPPLARLFSRLRS